MLDDKVTQLLLKISSVKHMGMTEIQKWSEEQLGMNPRTTIRNISKLVDNHLIKKTMIKGYGHDRYTIIPIDKETTHRMYMKNMDSGKVLNMKIQKEISKEIENFTNFIGFDKNDYYDKISIILWALNLHNKLTWTINSDWFGSSKSELLLAKSNRKELELFLKRTNENGRMEDYEHWHDILHTIYDIVDSHRVLTKNQLKRIFS